MGVFKTEIQIGPLDGSRFETVEAVVDTGASYTTVGRSVLDRLGIAPETQRQFRLANGQIVEFEVGYARLRTAGESGIVAVCFGPDDGPALLGATSLQVLAVDPVSERLVPAVGYMLAVLSPGRDVLRWMTRASSPTERPPPTAMPGAFVPGQQVVNKDGRSTFLRPTTQV